MKETKTEKDASDKKEEKSTQDPAKTWTVSGLLQIQDGADARLRQLDDGLVESKDDPFVPITLEEGCPFRPASRMTVEVVERKARRRRRGGGGRPVRKIAQEILSIEGLSREDYASRKDFLELTPIDPQPRMSLEYEGCPPPAD